MQGIAYGRPKGDNIIFKNSKAMTKQCTSDPIGGYSMGTAEGITLKEAIVKRKQYFMKEVDTMAYSKK